MGGKRAFQSNARSLSVPSVQILESSMLGLRTAQMVFRSRGSPVSITLYPMVHVGDERFYQQTYDEAFSHDVVLVEGVKSPVSRNLTRSYRWLNFKNLGLVNQPKAPPQASVAARIVKADLNSDEFHREWRQVSMVLRAMFLIGAPLYGLYRRIVASREGLARSMSLEDRQSADELLNWSPRFEPVKHSIIHARDQRLIECLAAELDSSNGSEKRIAVVYGARHMRAVLRELTKLGFNCSQSSWQTIISV